MEEWLKSLNLNVVDLVAIIFILLSAIHGLIRKLSGELAHLIGFVVAWLVGRWAYGSVGTWLSEQTSLGARLGSAVAFLIAVLSALLLMILLRWGTRRAMTVVFEPHVDRVGGLVAGLVRGSLIVGLVFFAVTAFPNAFLNRVFGEESLIGRNVIFLSPKLESFFEAALEERAEEGKRAAAEEKGVAEEPPEEESASSPGSE